MGQESATSSWPRPGMRTRNPPILRAGRFRSRRSCRPPQGTWQETRGRQKVAARKGNSDAKDHSIPLVRRQCRGGRQLLHLIFKNSKMGRISRFGDAGPGPKGSVMSVTFQIEGQEFFALNGGPQFKFTPAISFFVNCETQKEVDDLWEKLSAGGRTDRCGWLQDKFGVSWQIIPTILGQLLGDKDPQRAKRAMQAMLQMTKIDGKALQQAADAK